MRGSEAASIRCSSGAVPSYVSRGESLHYDERGRGAPILVVGGGPARHPDYLGDLGGIGDDFSLVAPHLRGIGRRRSRDGYRRLLVAPGRGPGRVAPPPRALRATVLAHSAGTRIALAFAERFPDALHHWSS